MSKPGHPSVAISQNTSVHAPILNEPSKSSSPADLRVVQTIAPKEMVYPGHPVTYTLAFSNVGVAPVLDAVISTTLSPLLTDINVTTSSPAIFELDAGENLAWRVENALMAGDGGAITITARVKSLLASAVVISATAQIGGSGDPLPENNVSQSTLFVDVPP